METGAVEVRPDLRPDRVLAYINDRPNRPPTASPPKCVDNIHPGMY